MLSSFQQVLDLRSLVGASADSICVAPPTEAAALADCIPEYTSIVNSRGEFFSWHRPSADV